MDQLFVREETKKEAPAFSFATVEEVCADGLRLLFDGEEEAGDKHYRCNTSVTFTAGDRVRVFKDSGTYVVEYVVGVPTAE